MKPIFICLLFISCSSFNRNENCSAIRVKHVVPMLTNSGKLLGYDTSYTTIAQKDSFMIYKLSYTFDSSVSGTLIKSEIRSHYVFFKKGNDIGLDLDSNKIPMYQKVKMDSLFSMEWIKVNDLSPIFGNENSTQLISTNFTSGSTLQKTYSIKNKSIDRTGSLILGFSQIKFDVDYSIFLMVDIVKNMKLSNVQVINNPQKYSKETTIDAFQTTYDLENLNAEETQKFDLLFETFKSIKFK